ncbi:hypothetical protein BLNAU_18957 [Blattamonas nauphoetae]|uniref:Actin-like protein N-terminal domain-containing protein n=1 Tax=Blattamonas nauphoetae TaxID=2049346 RepID=A0ABQ9X2W6_9EUKA|nr:hypothetical protein BLNAU_18957 [Blattamonas nauphoetae]
MSLDPNSVPYVLDLGTGSIRFDSSDKKKPSFLQPSLYGTPKRKLAMITAESKEKYIGLDARRNRGDLVLHHILDKGTIIHTDEAFELLDL